MDICNEQGVVAKFAGCAALDDQLCIDSIQIAFPDAVVTIDGTIYRVEFEYEASNFQAHGHDVRGCDVIICWQNDWPESVLPVVALEEDDWRDTPLILPSDSVRELEYWKRRAQRAEGRMAKAGLAITGPLKEALAASKIGTPPTDFTPQQLVISLLGANQKPRRMGRPTMHKRLEAIDQPITGSTHIVRLLKYGRDMLSNLQFHGYRIVDAPSELEK